MRKRSWFPIVVVALATTLAACTVDQTEEVKLPDVDVSGGELPKLDVDLPEIRVGTDTQTVVVPDVDVKPKEALP